MPSFPPPPRGKQIETLLVPWDHQVEEKHGHKEGHQGWVEAVVVAGGHAVEAAVEDGDLGEEEPRCAEVEEPPEDAGREVEDGADQAGEADIPEVGFFKDCFSRHSALRQHENRFPFWRQPKKPVFRPA